MDEQFLNPEYFINRELSMVEFAQRVLLQASDETIPLLERLKFLCIFASNLDEFYEIRVAGLKQLGGLVNLKPTADGLRPTVVLKEIASRVHELVDEQYRILNKEIFPALKKEEIYFVSPDNWTKKQAEWVQNYFQQEILPVVSPIALDPAHPMPRLINKSLNFILSLEGKDAFGRETHMAIVHAPRALPRIIRLPSAKGNVDCFVTLSTIIEQHAHELFAGMKVRGCYQFRITRNSDLLFDEEIAEDLAGAVKNKLLGRPFGIAVRLEMLSTCPAEIIEFLLKKHDLTREELYLVDGPVNIGRYISLYDMLDKPNLKYPPFKPGLPEELGTLQNLFTVIRERDIILHHPFQSFTPVVEFIKQATQDPNVLAIKQTLYRTGADSVIVRALMEAARAGKEVTAVIELRARFDEESNIELANRLQQAGVLVVYGVVNFKTHGKMILVVRREGDELQRYCHLSTGNYHLSTARAYTDIGFFTSDDDIGIDVQNLFQQLTGMGKVLKLKKLWQSPFTLFKNLKEAINKEIAHAKDGKKAHIILKMNGLTDPSLIRELYAASCAGVKIDLIVRGMCCLRPGIPGVSENITVRSIVGRFLEHERIYYFLDDGKERIYCSSADWMERNLYHRVETCFPIENKSLAKQIKKDCLLLYLEDDFQSWILKSDGIYVKKVPAGKELHIAQQELLTKLAKAS